LVKEGYMVEVDESVWQFMKKHLGYNDEEMKRFRENPRNVDVLAKAPALLDKTIVVEIVESKGCNSQHKVGDRFIFDGAGNLLTKKHPKRICIYALVPLAQTNSYTLELILTRFDSREQDVSMLE
jgi:hypothetical protein